MTFAGVAPRTSGASAGPSVTSARTGSAPSASTMRAAAVALGHVGRAEADEHERRVAGRRRPGARPRRVVEPRADVADVGGQARRGTKSNDGLREDQEALRGVDLVERVRHGRQVLLGARRVDRGQPAGPQPQRELVHHLESQALGGVARRRPAGAVRRGAGAGHARRSSSAAPPAGRRPPRSPPGRRTSAWG